MAEAGGVEGDGRGDLSADFVAGLHFTATLSPEALMGALRGVEGALKAQGAYLCGWRCWTVWRVAGVLWTMPATGRTV